MTSITCPGFFEEKWESARWNTARNSDFNPPPAIVGTGWAIGAGSTPCHDGDAGKPVPVAGHGKKQTAAAAVKPDLPGLSFLAEILFNLFEGLAFGFGQEEGGSDKVNHRAAGPEHKHRCIAVFADSRQKDRRNRR